MFNPWSPAAVPASRDNKPGWYKLQRKHASEVYKTSSNTIIIGDSIVAGLNRYSQVWENFFTNTINLGIGGDKIQHVLWRLRNTRLSPNINYVIVHCGTNNIDTNTPDDISNALVLAANLIHNYHPSVNVILSSVLPRDAASSLRRRKILTINNSIKEKCDSLKNAYFPGT